MSSLSLRFLRLANARKAQDLDGAAANVQGWVRSIRKQGKISFVELNDGSCVKHMQVVVPTGSLPEKLTVGSSVGVAGVLAKGPKSHGHEMELHVDTLENFQVFGVCDPKAYPLQKKFHSPEFLRDILHLRPRSNLAGAVLRVRNSLSQGIRNYFQTEGFIEVNTPVITSNDCEGAGEMFAVSPAYYFGTQNPAYLTVSSQLHAEMFACAMSRVFAFGPTFRAENSNTSRHLAEFWMVEPEIAFASMDDAITTAEDCVKSSVLYAMDHTCEDIGFFAQRVDKGLDHRLQKTVEEPFGRITYSDAVEVLKSVDTEKFEFPVEWGMDLKSEHERYLAEVHFDKPVFVTNYPKAIKPFYMKASSDGKTVEGFDLLVPNVGELIGGSAREDDFGTLSRTMEENNMLSSREDGSSGLGWYLDLRKYGTVPHAGWGMGFERLVQYVTGVPNIRDVIPVPRVPGSCKF